MEGLKMNQPYTVSLGTSFQSHSSSYYTLQYNFRPQSADLNQLAQLEREGDILSVTFRNKDEQKEDVVFKGTYRNSKEVECALIFDGDSFKLTGIGEALKHVRCARKTTRIKPYTESSDEAKTKRRKTTGTKTQCKQNTQPPTNSFGCEDDNLFGSESEGESNSAKSAPSLVTATAAAFDGLAPPPPPPVNTPRNTIRVVTTLFQEQGESSSSSSEDGSSSSDDSSSD